MHQIAITSKRNGHEITGSDDIIQDPSKSRLETAGILPEKEGFFADNISSDIDLVILGMHARFDNPELTRAMELGIKVLSFPEYIYENSKEKKRVVIGGSHGKTSITSMVMHCLKANNIDFDYLVGSSVAGFDYSVQLSDAPIIVIEGDEYLSSALNKEPKFIYYKGNIATISGIEWDHINVFKTEDIYNEQFKKLVNSLEPNAKLFYYDDEKVKSNVKNLREDVQLIPYSSIPYEVKDETFYAIHNDEKIALNIIGKHNMENLQVAKHICLELGVSDKQFWNAISKFEGAGRRLEKIVADERRIIFKDFAHSPSKLKATIEGVKESYPNRHLVACFEMHTYSTLSDEFLSQYRDTMEKADTAIIYIDKAVIEKKGNEIFQKNDIIYNFNRKDIEYFTEIDKLKNHLSEFEESELVYLMMSSGNFGGLDLKTIGSIKSKEDMEKKIATKQDQNNPNVAKIQKEVLDPKEKESAVLMFALSYLFFILPPLILFLLKKKTCSDSLYNVMASAINFQLLASFFIALGIAFNSVTWIPIYWIAWIFNIIYTSKAIKNITYNFDLDILDGLSIVLSRLNKS